MGRFGRRVSAVGVAAAVVAAQLGAQVLSTAPAAAAVPGLRVVHEVSESDSDATKVVFADCDDGEVILGGGGVVYNGGGYVTLHWLEPRVFSDGDSSYVAGASEVPTGFSGSWRLETFAICATAPVPGWQVVSEQVEPGLSSFRGTTVTCPGGKKVIGTGGTLFGGGYGQVTYHTLAPNSEGTRVTVLGVVDGPPFENKAVFGVRATAVCANPPPHWGWQMVSASAPVSDAAAKAVQRPCPGGKHVTGLGVSRTVVNGHAFVDGIYSSSSGRDAVVVGHQRTPRINWDLTATAICAVA